MFIIVLEPFGTFPKDREVRRSVRGRIGANRSSFQKIRVQSRRVPVHKNRVDRSPQVSRAIFVACTGPQESRGPVPKCQSHSFSGVYRSTKIV